MKLISSCLFCLLAFLMVPVAEAGIFFGPPNIAGSYTCHWQNPTTKVMYETSLLITKLRQSYLFAWTSSNGNQYVGNGLFNEKDDSVIGIIFNVLNQQTEVGVQYYDVNPDGTLTGPWILIDRSDAGMSKCVRNKS